ncbi:MAG: hypothetical protein PHY43_09810 [Verrucomicrobiales bacterium]|nr:hypothetical protein [Verrucomicrobiales bacterium]
MNSRRKGAVGEREFSALLREHGFDARRGQQFSGSPDSPDVVSNALAWLHVEVKRVQNLNLTEACVQAEGDCGRGAPAGHKKPWIVAHRRNHAPWLITMRAEFFFELLREFQPQSASRTGNDTNKHGCTSPRPSPQRGEGDGAHGVSRPTKINSSPHVAGSDQPTEQPKQQEQNV